MEDNEKYIVNRLEQEKDFGTPTTEESEFMSQCSAIASAVSPETPMQKHRSF